LNQVSIKQRIQIDFCLSCRGVWFDKDELSQIHQHGKLPDSMLSGAVTGKRDKVICESCSTQNDRSARRCSHCGTTLKFLCPACRQQMEEVAMGNVLIDRCHFCQGVWLDGGELTLLFEEFKQRKKAEVEQVRRDGGNVTGELATWAAIDALDLLIWRPDLAYRAGAGLGEAGRAIGDAVADVPGAVAHGVGAAIDGIGDLPEMAGDMAEGAVDLASGAASAAGEFIGDMPEIAGDVASGAIDLAGNAAEFAGDIIENVPEMAGAVAEAGASFIELLFEIIGSLFD
jgi:Zn-finger nucleic acid-binding protein